MKQRERKCKWRPRHVRLFAIACALLASAAVAPAAASAAPATDEYTLDLPKAEGKEQVSEGAIVPTAPKVQPPPEPAVEVPEVTQPVSEPEPEDHRAFTTSAPMGPLKLRAPAADPFIDGPMIALLGSLALISAAAAWRGLRRRTLPRTAG